MNRSLWIAALLSLSLVTFAACREEGPMERAGRAIDEKVDELTDKGPMEKAGEKMDDAAEAVKEFGEDIGEAAEDFGDKITD